MDYAVIMAGGTGKRLWPLSRVKRPKQVLKILDGETLLRRCYQRLSPMFDNRNIIVLTNSQYVDTVRKNLPEVPYNNVIAEPAVRDTAGAIGLAATVLTKYDPEATMAVVTADQLIEPAEVLQNAIKKAIKFVNQNPENIITFGIKPTYASTQFGYIKCGRAVNDSGIYKVMEFKEKPDEETAAEYFKDKKYLWNSGMFVWKAKTLLCLMKEFLPESTEPLKNIHRDWDGPNQQQSLVDWFMLLPKISIDYAIMEKAPGVHAIKLDCRWLDMGSFVALADFINSDNNKNIVAAGTNELLDCENSIIVTEDQEHLIACMGLKNVLVAHSDDATLICSIDYAHKIKELLGRIETKHGDRYL
ncbi:MAG TPA: sugar phosphate nucleotidyltransferase [Sedimentisphaerales bacterium]|nr:sugar phosphate nucleotidyltransferase [Sedimentisphaerales bacterium]